MLRYSIILYLLRACSVETLAVMIRQLLPETLEYLERVNTQHCGEEYTMWCKSQVHGLTETQCFLRLLSAVLERSFPKEDTSGMSTGRGSYSSRGSISTLMSESRTSSALLSYRWVCEGWSQKFLFLPPSLLLEVE